MKAKLVPEHDQKTKHHLEQSSSDVLRKLESSYRFTTEERLDLISHASQRDEKILAGRITLVRTDTVEDEYLAEMNCLPGANVLFGFPATSSSSSEDDNSFEE